MAEVELEIEQLNQISSKPNRKVRISSEIIEEQPIRAWSLAAILDSTTKTWHRCFTRSRQEGYVADEPPQCHYNRRKKRLFPRFPSTESPAVSRIVSCLRTNLLTILSVVAVVTGIAVGIIMRISRDERWTDREIVYVGFVGELFLRMLKCLIIPLIVSSLVSAVGSLDLSLSGRIATRTVVYYITTTISAILLGIVLVLVIHPGQKSDEKTQNRGNERQVTSADMLMDLVRNLFPPNLIQACFAQYKTVLVPPKDLGTFSGPLNAPNLTSGVTVVVNGSNSSDPYNWKMTSEWENSTNILGLVVFSLVLGIALGKLGVKAKPLLDIFVALSEAIMTITSWVIWFSPLGVLSLVAAETLRTDNWNALLGQLGMYCGTVILGLFIHGFIVLFSIFFLITRQLPFRFVGNMAEALATAFATSSSSATLPVALACLEEKNGLDPRITRFVMPIGATINMDGTALYEAVAAIFISQVRGSKLTLGNIIAVSITSTAASIGAAGIPQAGMVTMVMVLDSLGLPPEDVTLILAVDWLLDRFRTFTNVLGDSLGAGIVQYLSRSELQKTASSKTELVEPLQMIDARRGEANGCADVSRTTFAVDANAELQSTPM